jgi:hypothetical protein
MSPPDGGKTKSPEVIKPRGPSIVKAWQTQKRWAYRDSNVGETAPVVNSAAGLQEEAAG